MQVVIDYYYIQLLNSWGNVTLIVSVTVKQACFSHACKSRKGANIYQIWTMSLEPALFTRKWVMGTIQG